MLREEFRKQITTYILGALGLATGLAWNEAIKSIIDYIFPLDQSGGWILKTMYALILTIVAVIITVYLNRPQDR